MSSKGELASKIGVGRHNKNPKNASYKTDASRNSLRHGLTLVSHRNPTFKSEIEQMAKAICGDLVEPAIFKQAVVIAECELILRLVRRERVDLIEQFFDPGAISLTKKKASKMMVDLRMQQTEIAWDEFAYLQNVLIERGELPMEILAGRRFGPGEMPLKYEPLKERDEYEAMQEAMPDLKRLQRYERRALSRQKRAIRLFVAIMVARPLDLEWIAPAHILT